MRSAKALQQMGGKLLGSLTKKSRPKKTIENLKKMKKIKESRIDTTCRKIPFLSKQKRHTA